MEDARNEDRGRTYTPDRESTLGPRFAGPILASLPILPQKFCPAYQSEPQTGHLPLPWSFSNSYSSGLYHGPDRRLRSHSARPLLSLVAILGPHT